MLEQFRKESKKLTEGCPAKLIFKTFHETSVVLSRLVDDHSHPIDEMHLGTVRLPLTVRREIEKKIRDGMANKDIVSK